MVAREPRLLIDPNV